jgi:hypothetical protein
MPIICRLLQIPLDRAASLVAEPAKLEETVKSAKIYSGVYRYWDGIEYLLAQHSPGSPAAHWLGLGEAVSEAADSIPAARVLAPPLWLPTTMPQRWTRRASTLAPGLTGRKLSIPSVRF